MSYYMAAVLPPGRSRARVMEVMGDLGIQITISSDRENVIAFLKKADSKDDESPKISLQKANSVDQAIASDDSENASLTPACHPKPAKIRKNQVQNGAFSSTTKVPTSLEFLKIPVASHAPTDAASHQLQEMEKNTVHQMGSSLPRSVGPFLHEVPVNIFEGIKPIDLNKPRVVTAEADLSKNKDEVKQEEVSDEEMEENEEMNEEEDISDAAAHMNATDKKYKPKTPSSFSHSVEPFLHKAPVNIFEDIKSPIDLNRSRVVTTAIDLTKDLDKVKEEEISDEEMEEDEEENMSDAGAHVDPMDKEYKPKGSSLMKKPIDCSVCQKVFSGRRSLRSHQLIHTGVKPHQCAVCQKRFRHEETLTIHLRTHTGEKPYECDVCHKEFSRKGNCKRHMLVHSGEKRYECEVCKQRFGLNEHLKRHLRVHTGEKFFKCKDCTKMFAYSSFLKKHRSRFHP